MAFSEQPNQKRFVFRSSTANAAQKKSVKTAHVTTTTTTRLRLFSFPISLVCVHIPAPAKSHVYRPCARVRVCACVCACLSEREKLRENCFGRLSMCTRRRRRRECVELAALNVPNSFNINYYSSFDNGGVCPPPSLWKCGDSVAAV